MFRNDSFQEITLEDPNSNCAKFKRHPTAAAAAFIGMPALIIALMCYFEGNRAGTYAAGGVAIAAMLLAGVYESCLKLKSGCQAVRDKLRLFSIPSSPAQDDVEEGFVYKELQDVPAGSLQ